jgi:hypothetical protein
MQFAVGSCAVRGPHVIMQMCCVSRRFIGKIKYYKCENEGDFLWFPITRLFFVKKGMKNGHIPILGSSR